MLVSIIVDNVRPVGRHGSPPTTIPCYRATGSVARVHRGAPEDVHVVFSTSINTPVQQKYFIIYFDGVFRFPLTLIRLCIASTYQNFVVRAMERERVYGDVN